ncbi:MAG TPA: hypothetical protein VJ936_00165 [Desulfobacteraceae bacterium]|nr:hypothetical protein [Desulfobacteraceae bacterium]
MGKTFHVGNRESKLLSKIESSREKEKRETISAVKEQIDTYSSRLAMKLIENGLIETVSKNSIQEQIKKNLETLCKAEDFEIDYQIAPYRTLVSSPNIVSLYITAFIIEKLVDHRDVVDIFGGDDDIYFCIQKETTRLLADGDAK